jgi:hypothetical protein
MTRRVSDLPGCDGLIFRGNLPRSLRRAARLVDRSAAQAHGELVQALRQARKRQELPSVKGAYYPSFQAGHTRPEESPPPHRAPIP